jgi:hypothetical protein
MTERQNKEYVTLISNYVQRSDQILETVQIEKPTSTNNNKANASNIIMELRKCANHPLLRRSLYDEKKLKQMAKLIMKVNFFFIYKLFSIY